MKFYETTTEYNCGIDLHSRQMYICVMNQRGKKLVHTNITGNDALFNQIETNALDRAYYRLGVKVP